MAHALLTTNKHTPLRTRGHTLRPPSSLLPSPSLSLHLPSNSLALIVTAATAATTATTSLSAPVTMTDVRMGRGPLPQPPGYMAEQHEIAWYEHEERMRPSYVLQPTQHLYAQPQPQRRQPQPQQPPYQQGYTAYTPKQPPLSSSARWGAAAGAPQAPDRPGAEQATRQQHRSSFPATPSPVGRSLQHQTAASQSDAGTATGVAGTTMTQASWERCGSVSSTPVGVTGAFPSRPGAVHMYSTPSRLRTPHALEYDNSDMRRATKGSAFMVR